MELKHNATLMLFIDGVLYFLLVSIKFHKVTFYSRERLCYFRVFFGEGMEFIVKVEGKNYKLIYFLTTFTKLSIISFEYCTASSSLPSKIASIKFI